MAQFLFSYDDLFTGKVTIRKWQKPYNKPFSMILKKREYSKRGVTIKCINQIVAAAQNGEFISSVDILLVMAHFLENEWPIPKALSKYMAKTLQNTVIAFGHTDGGTNERNAEIAKAIGLVVPRGNAKKGKALRKKLLVHLYISWRQKLFGENLYTAAKKAMVAFMGTKGLSQDYCEKIYNEVEIQKEVPPYKWFHCDLENFFLSQTGYGNIKHVVFNDDEFLEALLPYAKTDRAKERWLEVLDRNKVRQGESPGRKKAMIHLYISWRQKLFGENLYTAAKKAMVAFMGTKDLSQDYCEKIYNEVENQNIEDPHKYCDMGIDLFFSSKRNPNYVFSVVFNDDEFLTALIPYAEDDLTRAYWLHTLEKAR